MAEFPYDSEITRLLNALHHGDDSVYERLIERVYLELKRRARRLLRGERSDISLMTTDLVHDVYLRMAGGGASWRNSNHFYGAVSIAMRRLLVDRARARNAQKRGGDLARTGLTDKHLATEPSTLLLELDQALTRLAAHDERKAKFFEMQYFAGFELQEIATAHDVSKSTVEHHLRLAKAWLKDHLGYPGTDGKAAPRKTPHPSPRQGASGSAHDRR